MAKLRELAAAARDNYTLEQVENAVIAAYCGHHRLTPVLGSVIAGLPASNKELLETLNQSDSWTLDDLVLTFETLVPAEEAAMFGAVFTPQPITKFMARELRVRATHIDLTKATIADPSVGCGALLVAMISELVAHTGQDAAHIASRMVGWDISEDSLKRAQMLIETTCLSLGSINLPQPQLHHGDMLEQSNTPKVDIVIANPPYVRYQVLDQAQRKTLAEKYKTCAQGNFNLYFAFFEVMWSLLKPGGIAGAITPNGFFTSASGKHVRKWMCDNQWLDDVLDFGHNKVFEAMTYTAISFATKRDTQQPWEGFGYSVSTGLANIPEEESSWTHPKTIPDNQEQWRLVDPALSNRITNITNTGRPLHQIADIRFGVATLRDKLYLLNGQVDEEGNYITSYQGVQYSIEPAATKEIAKVSGMLTQQHLEANTGRIIYPYRLVDGKAEVIAEKTLAQTWPRTYLYLQAIKDELARRDNGRKKYAAWYAYGRTQSLIPLGEKLLTPLYADKPRFLADTNTNNLFINGCAVTAKSNIENPVTLEELGWVLNSSVCKLFIESTAVAITSGYYAYQKKQLANLGIPNFTDTQRNQLRQADSAERDKILADIYQVSV